jgi:hypothetical protein
MADDNKNQHIVPQFHQKFFETTSDHKIFVRQKGKPTNPDPEPIKRTASEDDAYTVVENGIRDLSGDKLNSLVETKSSPKLKAISAETVLTKEQWEWLILYVANQLARSRRTRDELKDALGWAELIAEDMAPVLKKAKPMPDALAEMFGMKDWSIDEAVADLRRANDTSYRTMATLGTEPIADDLLKMQINLLVAPPGSNFILSDDPAVVYVDGKPVQFKMKVGFLSQEHVEVYLPLKPGIACLFSAKYRHTRNIIQVTKEEVEQRNRDMWVSCYKCIMGQRKEDLDAVFEPPKNSTNA